MLQKTGVTEKQGQQGRWCVLLGERVEADTMLACTNQEKISKFIHSFIQ